MSIAPTAIEPLTDRRITQRRHAVVALYGLSAFWGIAQVVGSNNALLHIAATLAFAATATSWFSVDRRIYERPRIPVLQLLFFFTWPIASFIHLVSTRGFRGCAHWLLHAVGLFVTMCLTFIPTILLLYWLGILDLDAMAEQ